MAPLPKFAAPPVVEVALSLQFAPLSLSAAHLGWYWHERLGKEWGRVSHAPAIADAIETFGEGREWRPSGGGLQIGTGPEPLRLQFTQANDERMIQVQPSRFVYNWRKREGDYPSFEKLLPEFEERYAEFADFVHSADVGEIQLNQWELTYVDHIPKGDLWESPADWKDVSPSFAPPINVDGQEFETLRNEWHFALEGERGRLRITANHAKRGGPSGKEIIWLQFTARGPVEGNYRDGFALGHKHAGKAFFALTSQSAQDHWKSES